MNYPGSLHNHTDTSNLRLRDAICKYKDSIDYAIKLGHNVMAFTEHESVSNAIKIEKYYNKIKKDNPEFKIILGNEIYLCRDGLNKENFEKGVDKYYHFILLAKNAEGHKQIREISTRAWKRSYKTGKMRRVPSYYQDLLDIVATNPGNVIGSTACLGGFLGTKILQWLNNGQDNNFYSQIINWIKQMEQIFGKGNFFLELQPSATEEQRKVNKVLLKISKEINIPYIITTDTHYLKKEDAPIHSAYLKSQDGDRETDDFYKTTYMMSTEELQSYMYEYMTQEEFDIAYQNIKQIADMCEDYSLQKALKIPSLEWRKPISTAADVSKYYSDIPYLKTFMEESDFYGDHIMAQLIVDKLNSYEALNNKRSYDEINDNLRITWISSNVNKAHWSAYFLNLQKIIDVCWNAGTIVGPGRGSGVGFYLLYILDIIQINPLWESTKTFSWRFLNPDRVSVLDIDTDIEGGRRAQVLQELRKVYGQDRVANVLTFGTEGSRSAIQTAARGLGLENEVGLYISSLIPKDRGKDRTLHQCYYGDKDEGFLPIPLFIQQMNEYPELWEIAQRIEGLICRAGEHAGGVIFVDEDFIESTALMRVPNGDIVTQFDLHDCEDASLIKIDLLSVEAMDKLHVCIDLLAEQGYIERYNTLRETCEHYLGIYNLERESSEMWKMVWEHKILSLFQMEKQSGVQGIALTHPESVDDLAVLNSIIRLMAQDNESEQPLNKYARFKDNISLWYNEMSNYGLTPEEQKILEPVVKSSYGIAESQEKFMQLVQMPECGGFNLGWADRLRKSIAKKNPAEYEQLTKEYFENVKEKALSENLCNYVWNVLVAMSRGYGFNASHTLAYSLIGLQEMNLAYKFPIIFWNCACLITDSGGAEDEDDDDIDEFVIYEDDIEDKSKKRKGNNYDKLATAIGKMRTEGINIMPPDINNSAYTFYPDVENNKILFGLRGLLNVGDEVIASIIENRPYSSPRDFLNKVKPKKLAMISLIKAGAFDNMMDRKLCMAWYLWETCDKKSRLTLQNMPSLINYNLIPRNTDEEKLAFRVYEFNRYLKAITKSLGNPLSGYYLLNERGINFLIEINHEDLVEQYNNDLWKVNSKKWDKIYNSYMNIFRNWLALSGKEILDKLNSLIFKEEWIKYAGQANLSSWEMEVMCFYYHAHELADLNQDKYGFVDFFKLPEDPIVERYFYKGDKKINLFKLDKICGTCIAKDKAKSIVTILTTTGVVPVKFRKEYFSLFDKQIFEKQIDGTKKIMERSWFNRGNMIVVNGMRSGDNFVAKKYASTGGHTLYRIAEVVNGTDIKLQTERYQGGIEEEDGEN